MVSILEKCNLTVTSINSFDSTKFEILCKLASVHYYIYLLQPRNLKGGIGSLFDPCVNTINTIGRPY